MVQEDLGSGEEESGKSSGSEPKNARFRKNGFAGLSRHSYDEQGSDFPVHILCPDSPHSVCFANCVGRFVSDVG